MHDPIPESSYIFNKQKKRVIKLSLTLTFRLKLKLKYIYLIYSTLQKKHLILLEYWIKKRIKK